MQRVLLIHDQALIPNAMCDALAQHYVLCNAHDIEQARALVQAEHVIILAIADIHAHERLGLLRELVVMECRVMVFLPHTNEALMQACIALGAYGIVENDRGIDELLFNVRTVSCKQRTYPADFLTKAMGSYSVNLPPLPRSSMQVLNVILQNSQLENSEIARMVHLSSGRVGNIFTGLYKKFAVCNRVELANEANRRGYFIGLNLVFPRGLNMRVNDIKVVRKEDQYRITL